MGKRAASAPMKRPSAKARCRDDDGLRSGTPAWSWVPTQWDINDFVESLLQAAGMRPADHASMSPLIFAGGCDGSGLPHYVLKKLVGAERVVSVIGSELHAAPALFLLKNYKVKHLFKNISFAASSQGPCWTHNKVCKAKVDEEIHMFVSGFSCKLNSSANSLRYAQDPIDLSKPEVQTFVESVRFIVNHKPCFYALENVLGALKPRRRGEHETPKMWYDEHLAKKLPEYTHAHVILDASPGPELRQRLLLVGSRKPAFSAADWAEEAQALNKLCHQMPRHHAQSAFSFGDDTLCRGEAKPSDADDLLKNETDYHVCFAKACERLCHE